MVAVLTILAFGAMGLLIAGFSHAGIVRERRAILAAQAQLAETAAEVDQAEAPSKPALLPAGKVVGRQIRLDGQRMLYSPAKPKRIRAK